MTDAPGQPTPHRVPPAPRCHWPLVLVIFAAGIGIGIGVGRMMWYDPPPEDSRDRWVSRIDDAVDLSVQQREQVGRIVDNRMAAFWHVRAKILPEVRREFDIFREQVAAVLTADQLPAWEKFCDERYKRFFTPPASQPAATPE